MTAANIRVDDFVTITESRKLRITSAAIVSLIVRTALECKDDLPDDVLDDLIERFRMNKEGGN
jgi:hypothetical protein